MPWHPAGGLRGHGLSSVCVYTLKCGFVMVINHWFGWKIVWLSGWACQVDAVRGWPSRFVCDCFMPGRIEWTIGLHLSGCVIESLNEPVILPGLSMVLDLMCGFGLVYLVCVGPRLDVGLFMEKILLVDDYSFITG